MLRQIFSTGAALCAVVLLAAAGCDSENGGGAAVARQPPPKPPAGKPLSDEEILAWAKRLEEEVQSGDNAPSESIDTRAILERATAPPPDVERVREEFIAGAMKDSRSGRGLASTVKKIVADGGSYSFLHVHRVDGQKRALFRLVNQVGDLNYHDFILAKKAGRVRAVDVYIFAVGELFSQAMRRLYLPIAADASRNLLERLTRGESAYVKHYKDIAQFIHQAGSQQYVEALRTYQSLPKVLRRDKTMMVQRIMAASHLDDQAYADAIRDFQRRYPNDPALRLMLLDLYAIREKYAEAMRTVDELDQLVGGDPYLHVLRAGIHELQGNLAAAKEHLRRAVEEDPRLINAYWTLLGLAVQEQDHEETLRVLRALAEEHGQEFIDLRTVPEYADFVESPQYQQWLEFQSR